MAATTDAQGAFPSPFSIATPDGCEGWEQMYPYYTLFTEQRPGDEDRLWFWNSMHFPVPMPPFDVTSIDTPYQAAGGWQHRAFRTPPAMGIDYRIINGYVYISVNGIDDPELIAERGRFFQARAGHYFGHWDYLYADWRERMRRLIAYVSELPVPELPEYEPDDVIFGDQPVSYLTLLDSYRQALSANEQMWSNHFEFLLLGYGAYLTFSEFCKAHLPDIPDQHVSQMIAGIDVLLFRPDAELRRLAKLAVETGVDSAFVEGRTPDEIDAELETTDAGRAWLNELESVKDPWFNMATGDGLYHYFRSWYDDPSIPYASLKGHIDAIHAGHDVERPTEQLEAERDRLADEYGALLDDEARQTFRELLELSRGVFPYVEEHKFYADYWFLTRFYNKIREFGALLAAHGWLKDGEDIFMLSRHEALEALEELCLMWATGGPPLGPQHWPPIVARRRELLKRLEDWTPPPALGAMPKAVNDPLAVMLWGITPSRLQEWAQPTGDDSTIVGAAASAGEVEGIARVLRDHADIADIREGEILVCTVTSPAWAPVFPKIKATVTDIGGVMSHAAIVCREYGMPAVVGTGRATAVIRTGMRIRVDGSSGVVTVLDGAT